MNHVQYWIDLADYDLETAKDLFKSKRWIYVAFMCHQVLEKTLKAYWCAKKGQEDMPYIHNLLRLAEGSGLKEDMTEEQLSFLDIMIPMNIEARYPSYKTSIAAGLNEQVCTSIISNTEELQTWIKSKL
ncbi:MAG: HEPN domain-containing protein [Paludibacteraceae bacterium]|nr:HEPN domain-containing protein [Paludibacteraceae bacterium]